MPGQIDRRVEIVLSDGTPVDTNNPLPTSGGGGGGGAVTITNGADAAEGSTADVAVTGDNAGTLSAKLRGLSKIFTDVWNSGSHYLTVGLGTTLSEANDSVTGHIGGYTKTVDLTITRPANVTAYSAGDEIADVGGTAGQRTLSGCGRVNGGSGTIDGMTLIFSENPVTSPTLEVYLFDAIPATAGDNNPFAPTDTELNACLGVITLNSPKVGTTGTGGNVMWDSGPVAIDFVCAGGSTSLFFLIVTRTAFTPTVNSSTLKLRVRVSQN